MIHPMEGNEATHPIADWGRGSERVNQLIGLNGKRSKKDH